jgi:ubiquinone/menaquinone biosynthesis C-methylase UbiE
MPKISPHYSIIRTAEYKALEKLEMNGNILDVAGGKNTAYHYIISGEHTFTVINLDEKAQPDFIVDIEKKFPFDDNTYNHCVCLNVLEHVWLYENAFSEMLRVTKRGGTVVITTPFMHHIHGSPDDYLRYTPSVYKRLAERYECDIVSIEATGQGLFSLIYQSIFAGIPTKTLRYVGKKTAVSLDTFFSSISKRYLRMTETLPLGYIVVIKKR